MNITIIGAGKVAWSLIPALQQAGEQVHQVISRNAEQKDLFAKHFNIPHANSDFKALLPDTELVILTVPDGAVEEVSNRLFTFHPNHKTIVAHTSGSVSIDALQKWGNRAGVFYPMQTFTLNKTKPYTQVPLFIEGNKEVEKLLQSLAERMSEKVQVLDSESRAKLHLGAVMVCNFTNLLYTYADELVEGVDIHSYEMLIRGHLENVFSLGPRASQTGPAARGDGTTIQRHLDMLNQQPDAQKLYARMSELIQLISQEKKG